SAPARNALPSSSHRGPSRRAGGRGRPCIRSAASDTSCPPLRGILPEHGPRRQIRKGVSAGGQHIRATATASGRRQDATRKGWGQSPSFFTTRSFTAAGLALPPVVFITCPTNQPTSLALALA